MAVEVRKVGGNWYLTVRLGGGTREGGRFSESSYVGRFLASQLGERLPTRGVLFLVGNHLEQLHHQARKHFCSPSLYGVRSQKVAEFMALVGLAYGISLRQKQRYRRTPESHRTPSILRREPVLWIRIL